MQSGLRKNYTDTKIVKPVYTAYFHIAILIKFNLFNLGVQMKPLYIGVCLFLYALFKLLIIFQTLLLHFPTFFL